MRGPLLQMAVAGLRQRPGQTGLGIILAALLLAAAAWVQLAGLAYRQAVYNALEWNRSAMVVTREGRKPFTRPEITNLLAINDVSGAWWILRLHLESPETGERITVSGVDPERAALGERTAGLVAGRFLEVGDSGVALAPAASGLTPGQEVHLGGRSFTVVGIYWVPPGSPLDSAGLAVPIADAAALYNQQQPAGTEPLPERTANLLLVGVIWPERTAEVAAQVQEVIPGAQVLTGDDFLARGGLPARLALPTPWATGLRWALSGGLVLGAAAVLRAGVRRSWRERQPLLAARLALGWPLRELRAQLATELVLQVLAVAVLAALGALAGSLLLSLLSAGFPGWPDPITATPAPVNLPLPRVLEPLTLAGWVLAGSLAALYAGWEALAEAAAVSPVQALAVTDRTVTDRTS